ncbi:hypothetical protein ACGYXH_13595, partial [Burkholderia pseudomallei]
QLKQPRPFSKIEMARRNQAGQGHLAGIREDPTLWTTIFCRYLGSLTGRLITKNHKHNEIIQYCQLRRKLESDIKFPSNIKIPAIFN